MSFTIEKVFVWSLLSFFMLLLVNLDTDSYFDFFCFPFFIFMMLQFVLRRAVEEEEFRVQFFILEILLSILDLLCIELPLIIPWEGRDFMEWKFIPLLLDLDSEEIPARFDFLIRFVILFWFIFSMKFELFWLAMFED